MTAFLTSQKLSSWKHEAMLCAKAAFISSYRKWSQLPNSPVLYSTVHLKSWVKTFASFS
jgi:hypothetical protein